MKYITDSKGITLIEVTVATVLLVSVLAPAFSLMLSCLDSFEKAGSRSQMLAIGKTIIEERIAAKDYSIGALTGVTSEQSPKFKYNLTISYYKGSNSLRIIKVDVYDEKYPDKHLSLRTVRQIK